MTKSEWNQEFQYRGGWLVSEETAEGNNTGEASGADDRTEGRLEETSEEVNRTETRQKKTRTTTE